MIDHWSQGSVLESIYCPFLLLQLGHFLLFKLLAFSFHVMSNLLIVLRHLKPLFIHDLIAQQKSVGSQQKTERREHSEKDCMAHEPSGKRQTVALNVETGEQNATTEQTRNHSKRVHLVEQTERAHEEQQRHQSVKRPRSCSLFEHTRSQHLTQFFALREVEVRHA